MRRGTAVVDDGRGDAGIGGVDRIADALERVVGCTDHDLDRGSRGIRGESCTAVSARDVAERAPRNAAEAQREGRRRAVADGGAWRGLTGGHQPLRLGQLRDRYAVSARRCRGTGRAADRVCIGRAETVGDTAAGGFQRGCGGLETGQRTLDGAQRRKL